jgi:hypothetical protein
VQQKISQKLKEHETSKSVNKKTGEERKEIFERVRGTQCPSQDRS